MYKPQWLNLDISSSRENKHPPPPPNPSPGTREPSVFVGWAGAGGGQSIHDGLTQQQGWARQRQLLAFPLWVPRPPLDRGQVPRIKERKQVVQLPFLRVQEGASLGPLGVQQEQRDPGGPQSCFIQQRPSYVLCFVIQTVKQRMRSKTNILKCCLCSDCFNLG